VRTCEAGSVKIADRAGYKQITWWNPSRFPIYQFPYKRGSDGLTHLRPAKVEVSEARKVHKGVHSAKVRPLAEEAQAEGVEACEGGQRAYT
jgi:hypothetical protein